MNTTDKQTKSEPVITKIASLTQLQGLVDAVIPCRFMIDGQVVEVEVKRMTPAISERQRSILRSVQPPYVAGRKDYDPMDKKYLEERDKADDMARCVIVYYCCPIISSQKACATNEEIHAFVNGLLTKNIQEIIAATAEIGGLKKVMEAANFTSPNALES